MAVRRRSTRARAAASNARETKARILAAFSERAKRSGIRSVVMGELATDLRMSASTLYDHFSSKEKLVMAMVDRWSTELAAAESVIRDRSKPPLTRFMLWADGWSKRLVEYSPAFLSDLTHDYPKAWRRLQEDLDRRKEAGAALLRPELRRDVDPEIALALLDMILTRVSNPRFWDRFGVSRQEVYRTALTIWADGALREGTKRIGGVTRKKAR